MRMLILALSLSLALAGCKIHVDLPPEFLVTEQSSSELKATTADDAIFWVERYSLPERGNNLEFWVKALKTDFEKNRGYVLLEEDDITTNTGEDGKQMVFETTTGGATYRYLVAVFIQDGSLFRGPVAWVARFTAVKSKFDEQVEAVKQAVRTSLT